jgi:hypothetical protein
MLLSVVSGGDFPMGLPAQKRLDVPGRIWQDSQIHRLGRCGKDSGGGAFGAGNTLRGGGKRLTGNRGISVAGTEGAS